MLLTVNYSPHAGPRRKLALVKANIRFWPVLLFLPALLSAADWGVVRTGKDADGRFYAVLENSRIRVRYAYSHLVNPDRHETYIREFIIKSAPEENNAADRIDAAAWRSVLTKAEVIADGKDVKTVRLEWAPMKGPAPVEEISIYPDEAFLRIDYHAFFVNVVDIGSPGGAKKGTYYIHGWTKPELPLYEDCLYWRSVGVVGCKDQHIKDGIGLDAGPLAYHGAFILGIYNPENGRGYGRVMPVESTDALKLLFRQGFEIFPVRNQPFTSYLYAVTAGPQGIRREGKRLAERLKRDRVRVVQQGSGSHTRVVRWFSFAS